MELTAANPEAYLLSATYQAGRVAGLVPGLQAGRKDAPPWHAKGRQVR